jgi:hypothetical protein
MRKSFAAIGVILLFAMLAAAQDVPKTEIFLGYTYVRANAATNFPAFSANGGGGQFLYNFNKWLGCVTDLGAVHNGNIGGRQLDTTMANFLFGPRLSIRYARITPYLNVLWGGVVAATSTHVALAALPIPPTYLPGAGNVVQATSARVGADQTAFAMVAGGGIDIKINKHLSFRPIGLGYYMTRLQNLRSASDNNQNNLRYTSGFNFTFGAL